MDNFNDFLDRYCVITPQARVKKKEIYREYVRYCARTSQYPVTRTQLCRKLMDLGCKEIRIGPKRQFGFLGIGLLVKPLDKKSHLECSVCHTINDIQNNRNDLCSVCRKRMSHKVKPAA